MLDKNAPLLKWWIQFTASAFGAAIAWHLGWWDALWYADVTKISIAILAIFVFATILTGYISKNDSERNRHYGNYVWFASEAMITLGMIGTVSGFLLMLNSAFSDLDVKDVANVQEAIADMAVGMSTALSTTLIGLICSVLTKLQMVILENSWDNGEQGKI
jgi:hypothetical protein